MITLRVFEPADDDDDDAASNTAALRLLVSLVLSCSSPTFCWPHPTAAPSAEMITEEVGLVWSE